MRELFQSTDAQAKARLPEGVRRFCVYDWRPTEKGARPDTASLKAVPGLARLAPDCQVVATSGSHSTDVAWQPAHEAFLRRVDWVPELPRGTEAPKPVRVAVLDTSPDGSNDGRPLEGRSGHGFAVGSIIRELGCPAEMPAAAAVAGALSCAGRCGGQAPGGCWCDDACRERGDCCSDQPMSCGPSASACIARVTTHLATPHLDETAVDYVRGGYFGTQSELAAALHRALSDWLAHRAEEPHLVINLSLGWDARYGGGRTEGEGAVDPAKFTGGVAAVYAMLERAACLGAIVVAAAGNDPGGPDVPPGPMVPALWETLRTPTRAQCRGLAESVDGSVMENEQGYRPLLYSVGGLGADDAALRTGRAGGRPRLAAAATHGVAIRHDGSSARYPTDILSGTSVAAAVVSGIAATVWGYRTSLSPGQVMDVVYETGTKVDEPADYHLAPAAPAAPAVQALDLSIRRVGLCEAVAKACKDGVGFCAHSKGLACNPLPPHTDAGAKLTAAQFAELEAWATQVVDGSGIVYSLPPVPVCGPQGHLNDAPAYPDVVCPERQYQGAATTPWTFPQPGTDPCPPCDVLNKSIGTTTVTASSSTAAAASYTTTLYVAIDSNFGQRLRATTLDLPGVGQISLPDIGVLVPGSIVVFKDIPVSAIPGRGAVLSFAVLDATGQVVGSTASVLLEQDR